MMDDKTRELEDKLWRAEQKKLLQLYENEDRLAGELEEEKRAKYTPHYTIVREEDGGMFHVYQILDVQKIPGEVRIIIKED